MKRRLTAQFSLVPEINEQRSLKVSRGIFARCWDHSFTSGKLNYESKHLAIQVVLQKRGWWVSVVRRCFSEICLPKKLLKPRLNHRVRSPCTVKNNFYAIQSLVREWTPIAQMPKNCGRACIPENPSVWLEFPPWFFRLMCQGYMNRKTPQNERQLCKTNYRSDELFRAKRGFVYFSSANLELLVCSFVCRQNCKRLP